MIAQVSEARRQPQMIYPSTGGGASWGPSDAVLSLEFSGLVFKLLRVAAIITEELSSYLALRLFSSA